MKAYGFDLLSCVLVVNIKSLYRVQGYNLLRDDLARGKGHQIHSFVHIFAQIECL